MVFVIVSPQFYFDCKTELSYLHRFRTLTVLVFSEKEEDENNSFVCPCSCFNSSPS